MNKIVLIGMPGTGKSYITKNFINKSVINPFLFNIRLIDIDQEIINKENKSIKEIFDLHGQEYFRLLEINILFDLLNSNEKMIICPGSGFIETIYNPQEKLKNYLKSFNYNQVYNFYKKNTFSIYLNNTIDNIKNNLMNNNSIEHRPLLSKVNNIDLIYNKRKPLFEDLCDLNLNTDIISRDNILNIISDLLY